MDPTCEGTGSLSFDGETHPAFCLMVLADSGGQAIWDGKVASEPEILRRAEQVDRLTFTFANGRAFLLRLTATYPRSGVAHVLLSELTEGQDVEN